MNVTAIFSSSVETFVGTVGAQISETLKSVVSESTREFLKEVNEVLEDPDTIKMIAPAICLIMAGIWCYKELTALEDECSN